VHQTVLKVEPPEVHGSYESRFEDYLKKSLILKQIMSNKARRYRLINAGQNFATVAVSSLLVFFGFSGMKKLQAYLHWIYPVDEQTTELVFNLLVFLLFVVAILHLVFRFSDKQSQSERAIAALAALSNEIEDAITSLGNLVIANNAEKVGIVRARYEAVAGNIPANSDREFKRAKRDLQRKAARKPRLHIYPQQLFDRAEQEGIVSSLALGSRAVVDALVALRQAGEHLYLGGGLIRNAVWDHLHGYTSPTSVDDVDVIYFDADNTEKRHDEALDKKLATLKPNVKWSSKNQARMHLPNNEASYASLEDAIARWPETATAMVVRLDSDGNLKFVAPYGYDDLLRLVVTNTPAFANRLDVIKRRAREKAWLATWPRLKMILSSDADTLQAVHPSPVPLSRGRRVLSFLLGT
jgi:hypothetical protein